MSKQFDVEEVKRAADGQWVRILVAAGMQVDSLDGRGHPCPKCDGEDRFCAFKDVDQTGGVMCRKCFFEKNGDGLAVIQWFTEWTFPETLQFVADQLGIEPASGAATRPELDIVTAVARAKRMPLDAFRQFGVEVAKRGKKSVARVPVYDENGEQHSYFDLTPDEKGWFKRGKGSAGMFFPGRLPKPGETWLLVEGCKDAAALVGMGFNAAGLPRNEMDSKYAQLLAGCDVIIVPDLDSAGTSGAQKTGSRLEGITASVRIARLPGEIVKSGGKDVRDVLAKPGKAAVIAAIDAASPWKPSDVCAEVQRPQVEITADEAAVTQKVLKHLAHLGWDNSLHEETECERVKLYQRNGQLVQVVKRSETRASGFSLPESMPQIIPMSKPDVRERITQAVSLCEIRQGRDGESCCVPLHPPDWLVSSIRDRGDYGRDLRTLAGITPTPTLRPDGSVIQTPGYDESTGLMYRPDLEFPAIPDHPTQEDARKAAGELLDLVAEFPFESESHRSVWLSCVLTLLARPAIDGPCPLFVFDANTRGAGKTLLADTAGIIAHGNTMARKTWPCGDDEVRKTITAVVMEAWPTVLFDNVATTLGGPSIDAALTGTVWQDRVLGGSRTTGHLPLTTVWLATGNNVELAADTARRVLMARLESLEEHPEDRADFRHVDIRKHVRAERSRLAVAGLTILRAYFAAGCPDVGIPQWGSFEAWSRLIRHAMVWAGCADPWHTRESIRDADRSAELVRLVHAGIAEADIDGNGLTTADMERLLSHPVSEDSSDQWPTLRIAMTELCGAKPQSRKIGYGLRKFRGRVCAGKRLESRPGHGGVKRWFVEPVDKPQIERGGDGGNGGDEISQPGVNVSVDQQPDVESSTGTPQEWLDDVEVIV